MDTELILCWRAVFCSIRSNKRLVSRLFALCLQHHFGQRRWLRQTFLSRCTSFSLLRSSRVAAGVDHPGQTKQRFKPGWQNLAKEVRNVMGNKECRDDHPYDMVI